MNLVCADADGSKDLFIQCDAIDTGSTDIFLHYGSSTVCLSPILWPHAFRKARQYMDIKTKVNFICKIDKNENHLLKVSTGS